MSLLDQYTDMITELGNGTDADVYKDLALRDTNQRILYIAPRQSGKTMLILDKALRSRGRVVIISPNRETAHRLYNMLIGMIPQSRLRATYTNTLRIDMDNTQYRVFSGSSANQLLGVGAEHVLIDELDSVNEECWNTIYRLTAEGTQIFAVGTPNSIQGGRMRDLYNTPGWSTYMIRQEDMIPGGMRLNETEQRR